MISFDEFLKQDEADKYNMLQECNAIIQQKENKEKEIREYIKRKDICIDTRKTDGSMDYVDLEKDLLEILDKDIMKKPDCNYGKVEKENK